MTTAETKKWVIEEIKKAYEEIEAFKGNQNPQVMEMYIQAKAKYDLLDELHSKLFKKYYEAA